MGNHCLTLCFPILAQLVGWHVRVNIPKSCWHEDISKQGLININIHILKEQNIYIILLEQIKTR